MKAIFEVYFNSRTMADKEDLKKYGNSWLKLMKYLYKMEGLGMFDPDNFKLVKILESNQKDINGSR